MLNISRCFCIVVSVCIISTYFIPSKEYIEEYTFLFVVFFIGFLGAIPLALGSVVLVFFNVKESMKINDLKNNIFLIACIVLPVTAFLLTKNTYVNLIY